MESTQKFDCWEELSDEESAYISGGTVGLGASSLLGSLSVDPGNGGASVGTNGVGGSVNVGATENGISYSGYNALTGKELSTTLTPSEIALTRS